MYLEGIGKTGPRNSPRLGNPGSRTSTSPHNDLNNSPGVQRRQQKQSAPWLTRQKPSSAIYLGVVTGANNVGLLVHYPQALIHQFESIIADMPARATSESNPAATASWWKILGLPLLLFVPISAVLIVIPPVGQSPWVEIAVLLALVGMIPLPAARIWNVWWAAYALAGVLSLQILLIGIKVWLLILPLSAFWLVPIVALYLLAWGLPLAFPMFSAILWREQIAPQTTAGRGCMALVLSLGGAAGGLAALVGLRGVAIGDISVALLLLALSAPFVPIIGSHAFSHQIVSQRPPPGFKLPQPTADVT